MAQVQAAAGAVTSLLPLALRHWLVGNPLLLPYYHWIGETAPAYIKHLYPCRTLSQFVADLEYFLRHFRPVTLAEVTAATQGRGQLPDRAFLLTFDDGFREMAEVVAPLLHAKGVPAVFFLNPAFLDNRDLCFHQKRSLLQEFLQRADAATRSEVESQLAAAGFVDGNLVSRLGSVRYRQRGVLDQLACTCGVDFGEVLRNSRPYLTCAQVDAMIALGFEMGAHSLDHPHYGDLTLEEQLAQTRDSMSWLAGRFGLRTRAFAFPQSDAGVKRGFFETVFQEGTVQASFGTAGLLRDTWPGHFQRFSMEKTPWPAERTIAWHQTRFCARRLTGRALVQHTAS